MQSRAIELQDKKQSLMSLAFQHSDRSFQPAFFCVRDIFSGKTSKACFVPCNYWWMKYIYTLFDGLTDTVICVDILQAMSVKCPHTSVKLSNDGFRIQLKFLLL